MNGLRRAITQLQNLGSSPNSLHLGDFLLINAANIHINANVGKGVPFQLLAYFPACIASKNPFVTFSR